MKNNAVLNIFMSIKTSIKQFLNGSPVYWKYSRAGLLGDARIRIRAPLAYHALISEQMFYKKLFKRFQVSTIFDIGANIGDKTEIFRRTGCQNILSVEPDQHCIKILKWRFSHRRNITILPSAVSSTDEKKTFYRFFPGSPVNTLESKWVDELESKTNRFNTEFSVQDSVEVDAVTFSQLATIYGLPDYAKIDVEGHEYSVIQGIHTFPRLLSLEFNLPEFQDDLDKALRLLSRACPDGLFNWVDSYAHGFRASNWVKALELQSLLETRNVRYAEIFFLRESL